MKLFYQNFDFIGGKPDDITVLLARVSTCSSDHDI